MRRNILLFVCRLIPALGFGALVVGADAFRSWLYAEAGVESKAGTLAAKAPVSAERVPAKNTCDLPSAEVDEFVDETYYCCPTTYNSCSGCCRASYPYRSSGGYCYKTLDDCMKDKTGVCYYCNGDKC